MFSYDQKTHKLTRAIDNVEPIITEIVKDIEEITGLKAHILIAGPEPRRGGKMVMFTFVYLIIAYIVVSKIRG